MRITRCITIHLLVGCAYSFSWSPTATKTVSLQRPFTLFASTSSDQFFDYDNSPFTPPVTPPDQQYQEQRAGQILNDEEDAVKAEIIATNDKNKFEQISNEEGDLAQQYLYEQNELEEEDEESMLDSITAPADEFTLLKYEYSLLEWFGYATSGVVGAVVGTLAVLPVTAFHYLVYSDYTYTTYAQWEFDLIAAAIQGAAFATTYRYTLKDRIDDEKMKNRLIMAFVIVKSLVRVQIPTECAAGKGLPLFCAEPLDIDIPNLDFSNLALVADITLNFAESVALFAAAANAMNWFLKKKWIRQYQDEIELEMAIAAKSISDQEIPEENDSNI